MTTKSYVGFLEDFLAYYKRYASRRRAWYLCPILDDYSLEETVALSHYKRLRQTIRRKLSNAKRLGLIPDPEYTLNYILGYNHEGRIRFLKNLIKRNKHAKVNN